MKPEVAIWGLVAEFDTPGQILHAADRLYAEGYRDMDGHTPFPVHGLDQALRQGRSLVPYLVLGGGVTGCLGALLLQWWTSAIDYPLVISGKPLFSLPAFIPVTFELTVLLSAFGAFFGMFLLNKLPRPHHPVFGYKRWAGATDDKFLLSVAATDGRFDLERLPKRLEELGGRYIEMVEA